MCGACLGAPPESPVAVCGGVRGREGRDARAGRKGALTSSRPREEAGQGDILGARPALPPTAPEQEKWGRPGGCWVGVGPGKTACWLAFVPSLTGFRSSWVEC